MPADSDAPTKPPRACPTCGHDLSHDWVAGQCPRCLLLTGSQELPEGDDCLDDEGQPRKFGDYVLLRELARGGMGVVFLARHERLDRVAALKVIIMGALASPGMLRMFQTEAQAAAALHHPNIVPVYETGEQEMQPYFTMRYVPGGRNMAHWAAEHRENHRAIAEATAKVARAVAHAHERGVLHRDLKPSNILWDPSGEPQITDFGLAKLVNTQDSRQTQSLHMIGSPSYMAPEQAAGLSEHITTATDVYGIGAVLYELLAGRPPFVSSSLAITTQMVLEQPPPPLNSVPRDLRVICSKCLAKRPEDRYASAVALADDLERFSRGEPVTAVPLSPVQYLWRWALRKPALAVLLVSSLVFLLVGISGIAWQWRVAERARTAQARALAHLEWQQIGRWLEEGNAAQALAYLAQKIRQRPDYWQAVMYAMSIVDQHSFPLHAGPVIEPPVKLALPASLAPDGSWVAAVGVDQVVRLWAVNDGRETAQLKQPQPVTALLAGSGDAAIVVALSDGAVQLYSSPSAAPAKLLRKAAEPIQQWWLAEDASWLVGRSLRGVEVWDLKQPGAPPASYGLDHVILGVACAKNANHILVWSAKEAVVWSPGGHRESLRVKASSSFKQGAISTSGNRIALVDGDARVRSWQIEDGRELPTIENELVAPRHLALDASGKRLTIAGGSDKIVIYDVESSLKTSSTMRHPYFVNALHSSPDGKQVFSVGYDDSVRSWDAVTGAEIMLPVKTGTIGQKLQISLSRDARRLLVQSPETKTSPGVLQVWQATTAVSPRRYAVPGQRNLDQCRLSPEGRYAVLGLSPDHRCRIIEIATDRVVMDKSVQGPVYVTLFSPDGRACYVFTANGWRYGWDMATGQPLWPPAQEPGLIRPGAISPDGSRLIAGHNDGHVRVYDARTGRLLKALKHPGEVKVLRFAPDGSGRFVSASTDQLAHVWNLDTGTVMQTFRGHSDTIISASWSPDARHLATASYDSTVRVWQVATGRMVGQPLPHLTWLAHVEFSPLGDLIATACRDGTARLWNPFTSAPVTPSLPQGGASETVRFTADGRVFLVRDNSGFRFWDMEQGEPVTVHYLEPAASGLGMDSDNWRAVMSADGTHVFLGNAMNDGALWSVSQPRGAAPAWFPDFLEGLARMRMVKGELHFIRDRSVREVMTNADPSNAYTRWALGVMEGTRH